MTELAKSENKLKTIQEEERKNLIEKYECEKENFKESVRLTNTMQKVINLMKLHQYEKAEY